MIAIRRDGAPRARNVRLPRPAVFRCLEKKLLWGLFLTFSWGIYLLTYSFAKELESRYASQLSISVQDRTEEEVHIQPNHRGYYQRTVNAVPERFRELLLKKEDRFFYYHPGINPLSIVRDLSSAIFSGKLSGSSTITQQLVKILRETETERTFTNKLAELAYAVSLELHTKKEEILTMYANTAYFGNQAQGIREASYFYFDLPPETLSDRHILELLAALNNPSFRYPGSIANKKMLPFIANVLGISLSPSPSSASVREENARSHTTSFEIRTLGANCTSSCMLTVDNNLTESLRKILKENLSLPSFESVENGAIVVIKLPENELLAIVGSPNPHLDTLGYQINMAKEPRPIGSTAKPFIYLTAFEKGARPYTLVEDREYKYTIGTGFSFYPKNYDGMYRGTVTLHEALANSLNVPSVKVLEYAGTRTMYDFLGNTLGFKPLQPFENYELGIALGALEMDLLTLSHYFTIFPNEGILKPLRIVRDGREESPYLQPPMEENRGFQETRVAAKEFTQLINKILSDRERGVEQFGMKSNLNLPEKHYALKTGTSRDFHDSWTIGYTPDFLVGVWVGNHDNRPMHQLSGQAGAGKIWHDAMELLLNSSYHSHNASFSFDTIREFTEGGSIGYGLAGDDYATIRSLMEERPLFTSPHEGDTFLFEAALHIPFRASKPVEWFVNGAYHTSTKEISWHPEAPGIYEISAKSGAEKRVVTIFVNEE